MGTQTARARPTTTHLHAPMGDVRLVVVGLRKPLQCDQKWLDTRCICPSRRKPRKWLLVVERDRPKASHVVMNATMYRGTPEKMRATFNRSRRTSRRPGDLHCRSTGRCRLRAPSGLVCVSEAAHGADMRTLWGTDTYQWNIGTKVQG